MSIFYKLELSTYALLLVSFFVQIIVMYQSIEGIKPTFFRMNAIALGATDVVVTPDEIQELNVVMEGIPEVF